MAEKKNEQTQEQINKRAAYAAAESRLRKAHPEEFEQYREEECAARGVAYTRRLSAKERAAIQMAALLEQYPTLADEIKG